MQLHHLCNQVTSMLLVSSVLPPCVQEDVCYMGEESLHHFEIKVFSICLLMVLESQQQLAWQKNKTCTFLHQNVVVFQVFQLWFDSLPEGGNHLSLRASTNPVRVSELQLLRRTVEGSQSTKTGYSPWKHPKWESEVKAINEALWYWVFIFWVPTVWFTAELWGSQWNLIQK